MPPNGISSLEDFRAAARADREARAEPVQLPSGLVAKLVRPTALEALYFSGRVPQSVAAKIRPADPAQSGSVSTAELIALSRQLLDFVEFVFVAPAVGPGGARPGIDIAIDDLEYGLKWARGEIVDGPPTVRSDRNSGPLRQSDSAASATGEGPGLDLAEFRPDRGGAKATPAAGATGSRVRAEAQ